MRALLVAARSPAWKIVEAINELFMETESLRETWRKTGKIPDKITKRECPALWFVERSRNMEEASENRRI